MTNYLYVYSVRNEESGKYVYVIQGDDVECTTKKECAGRIRKLFKVGKIDSYTRDYLLKNLMEIKIR
jgi:predicted nucleic acid-binding Zn ribbon protein